MSSIKSVAPRQIDLQPSRQLRLLLTALYFGALVSVVLLPQPIALRIFLSLIIMLSYPLSLNRIGWFNAFNKRYPWLLRPPVTGLSWRDEGEWELFLDHAQCEGDTMIGHDRASRSVVATQLLPSSTVLPFMSVLNFYCEQQHSLFSRTRGRRIALVLLPDSLSMEDFRQLRVRLLTQPLSPVDNDVE